MDKAKEEAPRTRECTAYLLMALWIVLSATVILFNKYVLSYAGFPFPISLTMIHMAFCSILSTTIVHYGQYLGVQVPTVSLTAHTYVVYVVPIGVLFSVVLWLGNSVYLYLSVSFIQMLKASMPVSVFIVGVMMGVESYSHQMAFNMVWIGGGIALASYGEINFVLVGVILQGISIFCESFRIILIQKLMQHSGIKMNSIQTMYYVSPCCFLSLCIPFTFLEAPKLFADASLKVDVTMLAANACCAFALNVSVYMLIGATSALTINVAGVVKDWLLIALSYVLFGSPISGTSLVGYGIAFAGVKYYDNRRLAAMRGPESPESSRSTAIEDTAQVQSNSSSPSVTARLCDGNK